MRCLQCGLTENQRDILLDIFQNIERLDKFKILFDDRTRNVTIIYEDCDDEWFLELLNSSEI